MPLGLSSCSLVGVPIGVGSLNWYSGAYSKKIEQVRQTKLKEEKKEKEEREVQEMKRTASWKRTTTSTPSTTTKTTTPVSTTTTLDDKKNSEKRTVESAGAETGVETGVEMGVEMGFSDDSSSALTRSDDTDLSEIEVDAWLRRKSSVVRAEPSEEGHHGNSSGDAHLHSLSPISAHNVSSETVLNDTV